MLVLKRRDGQWIEVIHRSGDVLRIRVYDVRGGDPVLEGGVGLVRGCVNLAFDDAPRHFDIRRPERKRRHPGLDEAMERAYGPSGPPEQDHDAGWRNWQTLPPAGAVEGVPPAGDTSMA